MRTLLLALALLSGAAWAQTPFPDVAPDHWAADAIGRIATEDVIEGFPDGTFRGDGQLNRYEAALMIDRLLATLRSRGGADGAGVSSARAGRDLVDAYEDLASRVERLESGPGGGEALAERVAALEAEVARLRARLDEAGAAPPAAPAEAGAPGVAGPAGPGGDPGAVGAPVAGEEGAEGAPADAPAAPAGAVVDEGALAAAGERPWRVALALGAASDGLPLRASFGHADLLGFAGLRATVDVPVDEGLSGASFAAHATRSFGGGRWSGYGGAGLGYRFAAASPDPTSGAFVGAVLGTELALTARSALFVEGAVDWHLGSGEDLSDDAGSPVRPLVAAGFAYRF